MAVQGRVEAGSAGGRRFKNLGVRADPGWRPGSVTAEMDGDAGGGGGGGGGFAKTPEAAGRACEPRGLGLSWKEVRWGSRSGGPEEFGFGHF